MPSYLDRDDLRLLLHEHRPRADKILIVLASFDSPTSVNELISRAAQCGLRGTKAWNISMLLQRTNGLAIRVMEGWELSPHGVQHLREIGAIQGSRGSLLISRSLRNLIEQVESEDTRALLFEAASCFEHKFYRAATILSWVAAVHVMQTFVFSERLTEFNAECARVYPNWKPIRSIDDFGRLRGEAEFLDRLVAASVIGKNVKTELVDCLNRRNACGHPNSYKLGEATVLHHLDFLIRNAFQPFARTSAMARSA